VKKSLLYTGVCISVLSSAVLTAHAQPNTAEGSGVYVSGNVGRSQYDIGDGFGKKRDVTAGGAVGYQFNPNIGVELGFNDYGKVTVNGIDAKARTTHASMILSAPIVNDFSVYGRLGAASTERKLVNILDERKSEAIYGVGMGYQFTKQFSGNVELQRLGDTEVSSLGAGVKYRF
jgi:opacity protein-like surface antigen